MKNVFPQKIIELEEIHKVCSVFEMHTVKFLNFGTPENFAVNCNHPKTKKRGFTIEKCIQNRCRYCCK